MTKETYFETPVRVAGTANSFTTMDPARPFLVVDRAALQLFEQRHRAQVRTRLQQRQQFGFPDGRQRIWARPPLTRWPLRRQ